VSHYGIVIASLPLIRFESNPVPRSLLLPRPEDKGIHDRPGIGTRVRISGLRKPSIVPEDQRGGERPATCSLWPGSASRLRATRLGHTARWSPLAFPRGGGSNERGAPCRASYYTVGLCTSTKLRDSFGGRWGDVFG